MTDTPSPQRPPPATAIGAFQLSLGQVFEGPLSGILVQVVALAIGALILLWLALSVVVNWIDWVDIGLLDRLIGLFGSVLALVLTWLLFPAVAMMIAGIYQDRVADAVEQRHYPDLPDAAGAPFAAAISSALRLFGWTVLLNLILLPFYLFLLPAILYFVINGYLLGREYFEAVALRRLDGKAARTLRRKYRWRTWTAGFVIAGLFLVPIANLAAPIIATAMMVHIVERIRWRESR